ncbi:hypothetical protein [Sutcliffiella horikoshii]|uniref:hypothetical protein n=1 Tax=Sutcliffiella horikoshii TaxID=79883 RepID=UPI00384F6481
MHPTEIIELMIVGCIILSILTLTLFLKGNWRKTGWTLALVILVAIFFVARPFWIDAQIDKKVQRSRGRTSASFPLQL